MRRGTVAAVIVGVLGAIAPGTAAQAADRCAAQLERVTTSVPRYVHVGERFELAVGQDDEIFEYVASNAAVESDGARVPIELPDEGEATTPLRAPLTPRSFEIAVTWEQTASSARPGTPACSARRVLKITALPASAKIGDLDAPRIEGRFRARLRGLNKYSGSSTDTVRLRALCAAGGCDRFVLEDWVFSGRDGVYRYRRIGRESATCPIWHWDGSRWVERGTAKRTFRVRDEADLRVLESVPGADGLPRATQIRGEMRRYWTPIGARSRGQGCNRGYTQRMAVTLQKL